MFGVLCVTACDRHVDQPALYFPSMVTTRELRGQLIILAAVLWTLTALDWSGPGDRLRFSPQVKGTDFVHFYTLARQAAAGALTADWTRQNADQVRILPHSSGAYYPPVYPPQVAALLLPLSRCSYPLALMIWLAVTVALYAAAVASARRLMFPDAPRLDVLLAALAFPAFYFAIQHGQLSMLALGLFVLFARALKNRARFSAGLALGLLAFKPSLLGPAVLLLLAAGEGTICLGILVAALVEGLAGIGVVGWYSVDVYAKILRETPAAASALSGKPYQMHSLRAFWLLLLPVGWSSVLYAVSSLGVLIVGALAWRRTERWDARAALLPLVTVLTSPHLYHYDLVILAPTLLWMAAHTSRREPRDTWLLTAAFALPLLGPVVALVRVQFSVLAHLALLWRWFRPPGRHAEAAPER
jgi:hypothetical protein